MCILSSCRPISDWAPLISSRYPGRVQLSLVFILYTSGRDISLSAAFRPPPGPQSGFAIFFRGASAGSGNSSKTTSEQVLVLMCGPPVSPLFRWPPCRYLLCAIPRFPPVRGAFFLPPTQRFSAAGVVSHSNWLIYLVSATGAHPFQFFGLGRL